MINFYTSGKSADKDLFDKLFFQHLRLNEITNNDEIILDFTDSITDTLNKINGYGLFTIDIKMKSYVILLLTTTQHGSKYHFCYISNEDRSIDAGTSFTKEVISNEDLYKFIQDSKNGKTLNDVDIVDTIITKTMLGYKINKSKLIEIKTELDKYDNVSDYVSTDLPAKFKTVNKAIKNSSQDVLNKYTEVINKFELPLSGLPEVDYLQARPKDGASYRSNYVTVARIDKVFNMNNVRYALVTSISDDSKTYCNRYVIKQAATKNSSDTLEIEKSTATYKIIDKGLYDDRIVSQLPYNYLDEGRLIIAVGSGSQFKKLIIFEDPKIKSIPAKQYAISIDDAIGYVIKSNIAVTNCSLHIEENKTNLQLSRYSDSSNMHITQKEMIKAIKNISNEYNYVVKKQTASGDDVKITDNILYAHESGKISYNDFAIEINNERIKNRLFSTSQDFMLKFFRKEITEEQIIEKITDIIYKELDVMVNRGAVEQTFNIKFNHNVDIKIEVCKGGNNFTYINESRVNKNEIVSILKEVSCYNSQNAADTFIKNITKKGLSVFVGLSSGYFVDKKYFKFKTTKTNGVYIMNIDGIDINIKGKKLFNTLFNIGVLDGRSGTKSNISDADYINNHVFSTVNTKFDYIKYKIMIDKSYQLFIDNSKTFLNKKVDDLGASHTTYHDNNGTAYDAIKVTGLSGTNYIIAYNLKESFVFMNADVKDETENKIYDNGTYICMIDQSKMKASVGYDTVVSKLLSLKNDSVIASTIYNLEDELNK